MAIDFPSSPTNGQVYANYIYDSSITAWRNVNTDTGISALNSMAFKSIVPTSVTLASGSATTTSNGTVTFSGASSVLLNGVFSSQYKSYKVVLTTPQTTDTWLQMRFAANGTINTGIYYCRALTQNNGAGTIESTQTVGDDRIFIGRVGTVNTLPQISEFTIDNPFVNGEKSVSGTFNGWYLRTGFFAGWYTTNASFDGLAIMPQSGTFGGTVNVYGITK